MPNQQNPDDDFRQRRPIKYALIKAATIIAIAASTIGLHEIVQADGFVINLITVYIIAGTFALAFITLAANAFLSRKIGAKKSERIFVVALLVLLLAFAVGINLLLEKSNLF